MTKYFLFLLLCGASFQACSQTPTPTKPAATTTAAAEQPKPAPYASAKAGWLVDLDEAYAISEKSGKPILANFTGSDWCGWCKKLDADVFSKPAFKEWADKNVVLLELDFPRRFKIPQKNAQQNAGMAQALGITGYPTVWVLDLDKDAANGQYQVKGLGRTGYTPTPEQFIASIDKYVKL
jgi:protein disulfide-isomerase